MTLSLISIGLNNEKDLSIRAIEETEKCTKLYAELYTMKLTSSIESLSLVLGKEISPLLRSDMEESMDKILREAKDIDIGILVGGDCLSATTHLSLVIEAVKKGIDVKIIHGSSIFTAITECGLSIYKFGRTVTMPLPEKGPIDSVIKAIEDNNSLGLHTLVLLDLDTEENKYMTITHALERMEEDGFNMDSLVVGLSRLGLPSALIRAGKAEDILNIDFGEPPHCFIIPSHLHFLEAEALKVLAECPEDIIDNRIIKSEIDILIQKYVIGCRRVLQNLILYPPKQSSKKEIEDLIDHVNRYLDDAEYYMADNKPTALTSVAYAEGILDALKLLGLAEFEW
ncbi:diphthine synthase [Candidatus Bathyarchaeota archaeon]|nr:diphthine synthase [Candidatus Bathyarchaeota archaeon]